MFIVAYKFSDAVNAYVKYAEGFKSGGFNGEANSLAESITPFQPEKLKSYEAGLKTSFADGRAIVNLAAFFAWHTFWPQGTSSAPFGGPFEWLPVLIAAAAFLALWKYKADIMQVIGVCALLGLALTFVR